MKENVFRFKEFKVNQHRCAMKIGTDAVLLGGWTNPKNEPTSVLDIGAGTGILSLMMAQKFDSESIDALEIDDDAYEQCVENFENSLWSDRLFCYHASFQEFTDEFEEESYDLIISNPPFFKENQQLQQKARKKAREQTSLPFSDLLSGVSKLLTSDGFFSVIIPYTEEGAFVELAKENALYPAKITRVRGTISSELKRSMLLFSKEKSTVADIDELILERSRHHYTDAYKRLVQDFYIYDKHQL